MKTGKVKLIVAGCFWICFALVANARQGTWDSLKNNNNSGIPGSGNSLPNNNGPESPHTTFPVQSTDPGPLYHGPSNLMFDSIPDPQKYARPK